MKTSNRWRGKMTDLHKRIFALFLVVLFFVSSFGLTFFVIWQAHQNSSSTNTSATTPAAASKLAGTELSGFTPVASVPVIKITDLKTGTGNAVKATDSVTVDYTGAIAATGIIFQSSKDTGQPVSQKLSAFIPGWVIGVPGMKVGGTRRLLIPAALAYGPSPPQGSGIPANADLVFDITLDKIN